MSGQVEKDICLQAYPELETGTGKSSLHPSPVAMHVQMDTYQLAWVHVPLIREPVEEKPVSDRREGQEKAR